MLFALCQYFRAGFAGNGPLDVLYVTDDSRFSGCPVKLHDGLHLGAHGAGRELPLSQIAFQFRRRDMAQLPLLRRPPTKGHAGHIRGDNERVRPDLARETALARSLSMTASTPLNLRSLRITGMPPPPQQMTMKPISINFRDLAVLDDRQGPGRSHHTAEPLSVLDMV